MRSMRLVIGFCLAGTAVALAVTVSLAGTAIAPAAPAKPTASARPWPSPTTVYLGNAAALDQLRLTNPKHYARVQRILASAAQLCKAGEPKLLALQSDAQDMHCGSMLFTSNPPQRQLSFRLDDIHYIAMVFLKVEGKLTPAELDRSRRPTAAVAVQQPLPRP